MGGVSFPCCFRLSHLTPYGTVSCSWKTTNVGEGMDSFKLDVSVPYGVIVEIIMPSDDGERKEDVGPGEWTFETTFSRDYEWPVEPLKPKSGSG